jgi:hypothetical protein
MLIHKYGRIVMAWCMIGLLLLVTRMCLSEHAHTYFWCIAQIAICFLTNECYVEFTDLTMHMLIIVDVTGGFIKP